MPYQIDLGSGAIGATGPAGVGLTPPYFSGWDVPPLASTATTAQPVNGQAAAVCFLVPAAGATLSVLEFTITTLGSAGALAKIILWSDDGTGYPGAILYEMPSGERVVADSGGTGIGIKTHTPDAPIALAAAGADYKIWGAVVTQGAPGTLPIYRGVTGFSPAIPLTRAVDLASAIAWNKTGITAAAPAWTGTAKAITGTAALLRLGVQ